ncbi:MAG TPA: DUF3891 family protein, partial [Solirubrobacteraceae bacterium]|nr:DUF3891 family protein [Solirubrobacteraceae bacterium]
ALLAIMHGRRLYESFDRDAASDADSDAVSAFLEHAAELEAALLQTLRSDPFSAPHATPERVSRNSRLVWTWDLLSLALLLDWAPLTLEAVPAADGTEVDIALRPLENEPLAAALEPWPFRPEALRVHCEGRRLSHGFADDDALRDGLARASWETVEFTLLPGAELREGT